MENKITYFPETNSQKASVVVTNGKICKKRSMRTGDMWKYRIKLRCWQDGILACGGIFPRENHVKRIINLVNIYKIDSIHIPVLSEQMTSGRSIGYYKNSKTGKTKKRMVGLTLEEFMQSPLKSIFQYARAFEKCLLALSTVINETESLSSWSLIYK